MAGYPPGAQKLRAQLDIGVVTLGGQVIEVTAKVNASPPIIRDSDGNVLAPERLNIAQGWALEAYQLVERRAHRLPEPEDRLTAIEAIAAALLDGIPAEYVAGDGTALQAAEQALAGLEGILRIARGEVPGVDSEGDGPDPEPGSESP